VVLCLTYIESNDLCPAMRRSYVCVCIYTYMHAYPLWSTSLGHVWLNLSSLVDGDRFECALMVYRRSRGIVPFILNLDARRRLVVNFAPRPIYPEGDELPVPVE